MENHNEDFFARTDIVALRAMRRQYPGLRRLLRRDDTLKDADLLTVYGVLLADKEFTDASTIWALSRACRSMGPAMAWVSAIRPHAEPIPLAKGAAFPDGCVGLFLSPLRDFLCSCIVLPKLRIMRWCRDKALPTCTHTHARVNGVFMRALEA